MRKRKNLWRRPIHQILCPKCGETRMAKTFGTVVICQKCSIKEVTAGNVTHNMTNSDLYRHWADMRQRCRKELPQFKKNYFDRGIAVCEEWQRFEPFMKWSLANGYSPKLQIDRIDNDKGYSPDNCRWVTRHQNMRNMRKTVFVELNGEKVSLPEACERLGLKYATLYARVKSGRPLDEALYKHYRIRS